MEEKKIVFEFDDAVDKLYRRRDGGEDTPKGVAAAKDYPDFDSIPDPGAAAIMVSLDIFRGVPEDGGYVYGGDRLVAESAFKRMVEKACGTPFAEVFKIERSEGGISSKAAKELLLAELGGVDFDFEVSDELITRNTAGELMLAALKASKGLGRLPYVYFVEATTSLTELELPKNSVAIAPDGQLETLTQNGVFMPLVGGYRYEGDVVLTVTDRYDLFRYITDRNAGPGGMSMGEPDIAPVWWNDFNEPYRAALYIENGEKVAARSIDSAYHADENGIYITSDDAPTNAYGANDFNGIIINGGKYDIDNLKIRFEGNGRDDFQGMGAGVLLTGEDTECTITNADISNHGTVRSSLVIGGKAKVLVKDSSLETRDGFFEKNRNDNKMRTAPNQGGFEGNCRATNLLDKGITTYFNSRVTAEKWGVLSTDNNKGVHIGVINTYIGITGGLNEKVDTSSEAAARASLEKIPFSEIYGPLTREIGPEPTDSQRHPGGYGNYSIGDTLVSYFGSTVTAADYGAVCKMETASVSYGASKVENLTGEYGAEGLPVEEKNTVVYVDKTGVMIQNGTLNHITIKEGTVFHCGCHCFAVKSNGCCKIDVDDSTLIAEEGTILQMMDEDDLMGKPLIDPPSPTEEEKAIAKQLILSGKRNVSDFEEGRDCQANYSNMTVCGDTYNSCGYSGLITEEELEELAKPKEGPGGPMGMMMGGPGGKEYHSSNARNLRLRLDNVKYSGVISTGEGFHYDRHSGKRFDGIVPTSKWYCISVLRSEPKPVYQAGMILEMKNGSEWNVTRTCYLSALTVDDTSVINGKVYVNDEAVALQPGVTYKGFITVQPGK